jgi:hypothetical protein
LALMARKASTSSLSFDVKASGGLGKRRVAAEEFRIGIGGPLHRLEHTTRIEKLRHLVLVAIGVTWIPLLVFWLGEWWITNRIEPMVKDLSIHVRLLVTLPLLLAAERLLDRSCRYTVARLFDEGFIPPAEEDRARAILRSAVRWRDSPVPETILFLVAIASGAAALVGILPAAGLVHGVVESRSSMAHTWYALVSLPIFQFVLWRSLFRWGLWVGVLGGFSRVPLRLLPMHADRRGGIGFLKNPSISYCGVLLFAVSSVLCGAWGTQVLLYGTKIDTLRPLFYAFVAIGTIIAFAPLLTFVPQLWASRKQGRRAYGGLVTDYARALQERWIGERARTDLLGSPDFQSLADLTTSYSETVAKMQVFLFGYRDIILLFIISQLPAIPVVLSEQSVSDIFIRLLHLFVGGIPG